MIGPLQEFRELSEEAVVAAMLQPNTAISVMAELNRLTALYSDNFATHVMRLGYIPEDIRRLRGRWPIEEIAIQLARTELFARHADTHPPDVSERRP